MGGDYIENLRAFDSHERGILLQWAAGQAFPLSEGVRHQIGEAIDRQVPERTFLAMDYTLDWLYAALQATIHGFPSGLTPWPKGGQLKATQEDIDLLVAWDDRDGPHTVLLEAKGFTGWSNSQMASKAARLKAIFSEPLAEQFDVHFMLAGPKASQRLATAEWPAWMKHEDRVHFLAIGDPGPRYSVQRCDEHANPVGSSTPSHWLPVKRAWATPD